MVLIQEIINTSDDAEHAKHLLEPYKRSETKHYKIDKSETKWIQWKDIFIIECGLCDETVYVSLVVKLNRQVHLFLGESLSRCIITSLVLIAVLHSNPMMWRTSTIMIRLPYCLVYLRLFKYNSCQQLISGGCNHVKDTPELKLHLEHQTQVVSKFSLKWPYDKLCDVLELYQQKHINIIEWLYKRFPFAGSLPITKSACALLSITGGYLARNTYDGGYKPFEAEPHIHFEKVTVAVVEITRKYIRGVQATDAHITENICSNVKELELLSDNLKPDVIDKATPLRMTAKSTISHRLRANNYPKMTPLISTTSSKATVWKNSRRDINLKRMTRKIMKRKML
ncbi:hypothetical protein MAR_032503 [Mya arenaria]|uniref:Uncharacterized protein n=1 Tax=Mya arenaria TaxID=6604 RepID=A0ABY7F975_MYAAR|nr:hypothetical protein MAR_032503 [Mya arenaria]